jgi:hypothetical protein
MIQRVKPAFASLRRGSLSLVFRSKRNLADGRGFEPLVPCGTHAFQACTIDRSVTHPLDRKS